AVLVIVRRPAQVSRRGEPDEFIDSHRIRFSLEFGNSQLPCVHVLVDQFVSALADDDASWRCIGLKPSGDVGRISQRREVPQFGATDISYQCRTRVDANAEHGPPVSSLRRAYRLLQSERGPASA